MLAILALACRTPTPPSTESAPPTADFTVRAGVHIATVLDARPGEALTLIDVDGSALIELIADGDGQAHFAYVPDTFITLDTQEGVEIAVAEGGILRPGAYTIESAEEGRTSGPFDVLAADDVPDDSFYDQPLDGIPVSPLTGAEEDEQNGFQYITTRDGTQLSVMVRFPDPLLYGDGPYPTVIEYSGYSPSRPDRMGSGQQIANALGYAVVGVNMRGSGCSDGVFDVFNTAQHTDGYDAVEIVARQPWALNNQVGMVGLSYPGITQLFVASTRPPSLAAVLPFSVIADGWQMQYPGGIYNSGFTEQWLEQRRRESDSGGSNWVSRQIEEHADEVCEQNVRLSSQNMDFEPFFRAMEFRPEDADERDLTKLVGDIEVPVYLAGSWQDEQTGALFGGMLDGFERSDDARFLLHNGRHPDGYAPDNINRMFEFLEFYVAERVPVLNPLLRTAVGADAFGTAFDIDDFVFEEDRFAGMSFEDALEAYRSEPRVRLLFEVGAGGADARPIARNEANRETWPTRDDTVTWALGNGTLGSETEVGIDAWTHDPEAGARTFFGPAGYSTLGTFWDIDWSRFEDPNQLAYLTAPFEEDTVLAGPGVATLWVRSPEPDFTVQVTLTEVRPDGLEVLVQSGWLRAGHRAGTIDDFGRIERSFSAADYLPMPMDALEPVDVMIPSFAHPFRAGSQLRMTVSSPGRNHGTWLFDAVNEGAPRFELARGPNSPSQLELGLLEVPVVGDFPPCPSLRGQPCRSYVENVNTVLE